MRAIAALAGALLVLPNAPIRAQTNPVYIPFSPRQVKAVLYRPDSGPPPHVAILTIHRTGSVLQAPWVINLSRRGFMVLAINPRSDNNEAIVDFEANALDIKSGIEFLRRQPGIRHVLLYGQVAVVLQRASTRLLPNAVLPTVAARTRSWSVRKS